MYIQIISKKTARSLSMRRYYTGLYCCRGHNCERFSSTGGCVICCMENSVKWKAENKEKSDAWYRKHAEENKEKIAARRTEYEKINRARITRRYRDYHARNPGKRSAIEATRRARKNGAGGEYTQADIARIYSLQNGKCTACLKSLKDAYHADHIMPIALGGSSWPENIQLMCPSCNHKKHSASPEAWAKKLGRLI